MRHVILNPRENYKQILNRLNFTYHTKNISNEPFEYWLEGHAYEFKLREIEEIKKATIEVNEMFLYTADKMIKNGKYPKQYNFDDETIKKIEESYYSQRNKFSLMSRLDFCYNTENQLKLYEYDADSTSTFFESAIIQREWLNDIIINKQLSSYYSQENNIEENIINFFERIKEENIFLAFYPNISESNQYFESVHYLASCVAKANKKPIMLNISNISYNYDSQSYVFNGINLFNNQKIEDLKIEFLYKMYPIEFFNEESDEQHIGKLNIVEPIWKGLILGNKCTLIEVYNQFKNHPLLLKTEYMGNTDNMVKKPKLGREGSNIIVPEIGYKPLLDIQYIKEGGYIYQEYAKSSIDEYNYHHTISSWLINNKFSGVSVRIDENIVNGYKCHFLPHYIA